MFTGSIVAPLSKICDAGDVRACHTMKHCKSLCVDVKFYVMLRMGMIKNVISHPYDTTKRRMFIFSIPDVPT